MTYTNKQFVQKYNDLVQQKIISYCQNQQQIVNLISKKYIKNFLGQNKYKGIYLYGPVGTGKTMLINNYLQTIKHKKKHIRHIHSFFQEIHEQLQYITNKKNPLHVVIKNLRQKAKIIFLDEFHINDIGNAMLFNNILKYILLNKMTIFITSNQGPHNIFEYGLNKKNFESTIKLITNNMLVLKLNGEDFRIQHEENLQISNQQYINQKENIKDSSRQCIKHAAEKNALQVIIAKENKEEIYNLFLKTINNQSKKIIINNNTRKIIINNSYEKIAYFSFQELFFETLGAKDYEKIIQRFDIIFLETIPNFTKEIINEIERLSIFVDKAYENNKLIICAMQNTPLQIYYQENNPLNFQRTISRLIEMRSKQWLNLHKNKIKY